MQVGQKIQRNELMLHLPDEIWQKKQHGKCNAGPKPAAAHETSRVSKEHRARDPESEKSHRVTRFHTHAQADANRHPPARILRLQQPNDKIRDRDTPQIVERDVLEYGALDERNRSNSSGDGSEQLKVAVSAEFRRNRPRQHHDHTYGGRRKDAKANKRSPEKDQLQTTQEGRDWRIRHKTPVKVTRIIESLKFITVKSVPAIGREVSQQTHRCDKN